MSAPDSKTTLASWVDVSKSGYPTVKNGPRALRPDFARASSVASILLLMPELPEFHRTTVTATKF
jgi:hypothetical protein